MAGQVIPKVFHTLWVQGRLPDTHQAWFDSWLEHNPGWEHKLWSESDWFDLVEAGPNGDIYGSAVNHAQRAEIARFEILYWYGGVTLDADFQCLRRWDGILDGVECFAPFETGGHLTMSLLGAVPGHEAVRVARADIERSIVVQRRRRLDQTHGAGPKLLQRLWLKRGDVTRFPPWMFFPYLWTEPDPGSYGDAYAVHHWTASWKTKET